jgi:hypothetical protein
VTDRLCDHVSIIPACADSRPWILSVFRDKVRTLEGAREAQSHREALGRLMCSTLGRVVVAVPTGYTGDFCGWAASIGGMLVFAYVRDDLRANGIGNKLIVSLGVARPVGVAYWTEEAQQVHDHGYPLEYSHSAYLAMRSLTRGHHHDERKASAA